MSKISCLSFIRRHISFMRTGQIFTTRDCLVYGKRSNVDNALFRCVRSGLIIRLARGVFTRRTNNFVFPSAFEIAMAKAQAFAKRLLIHGVDIAAKHKLIPAGNPEHTYYVDGSTSRFKYLKEYINLRKLSRKMMQLSDDPAGLTIRALCSLGRRGIKQDQIDKLDSLWNTRVEREKIYRGKAWMPAWLGDRFPTEFYYGPFGPAQSVAVNP